MFSLSTRVKALLQSLYPVTSDATRFRLPLSLRGRQAVAISVSWREQWDSNPRSILMGFFEKHQRPVGFQARCLQPLDYAPICSSSVIAKPPGRGNLACRHTHPPAPAIAPAPKSPRRCRKERKEPAAICTTYPEEPRVIYLIRRLSLFRRKEISPMRNT